MAPFVARDGAPARRRRALRADSFAPFAPVVKGAAAPSPKHARNTEKACLAAPEKGRYHKIL